MKLNRHTLLLICILVLVILIPNEVHAMHTDFATEELSQEDQKVFLKNISVSRLMSKPEKRSVLCFDVNEQGLIAIGQAGTHGKEVCVYTADGSYLYGYSFNCSQSFYVEWDKNSINNINIYFVRSDIIISLDPYANLLDIKKVQNTIENNSYRLHYLNSTKRFVNGSSYEIINDTGLFNSFASSYSQLIVINSAGNELIVYDVSTTQTTKSAVIFIITFALILIVVISIIKVFISNHKH